MTPACDICMMSSRDICMTSAYDVYIMTSCNIHIKQHHIASLHNVRMSSALGSHIMYDVASLSVRMILPHDVRMAHSCKTHITYRHVTFI